MVFPSLRYKASTMRTALLFLASVAAASAWAGVLAPSAHMTLRTMRCREGSCATAAVVESADGASGMTDALRLDRRAMLKFASKVAATPPLAAAVTWPTVSVAETLDKDTAEAIGKVPLDVLKAIAGGSEKEFKSKLGEYESDLAGIELALFQAYMYGSDKLPEPEVVPTARSHIARPLCPRSRGERSALQAACRAVDALPVLRGSHFNSRLAAPPKISRSCRRRTLVRACGLCSSRK